MSRRRCSRCEASIAELRARARERARATSGRARRRVPRPHRGLRRPRHGDRAERRGRREPRGPRRGRGVRRPARRAARRSVRSTASRTPRRTATSCAGSPRPRAARPSRRSIAQRDAFTIERLRAGGAICLGLTNMPPMANGGMQRGVYGRAESPYNAGLPDGAVRLGLVERFGHGDRRELRGVRARRGDLVERTRARVEQRPVRLHALARRHLGARQLAAGADDGRGRAAHPHDGRPARGARRHRRRRRRDARRLLARAAVGRDARARLRCARRRTRRSRRRADARAACRIGIPRMYINADPDAGTGRASGNRRPDRAAHRDPGVASIALWEAARARPRGRRRDRGRGRLPRGVELRGRPARAPDHRDPRAGAARVSAARDRGPVGVGVGGLPRRPTATRRCDTLAEVDGAAIFPHPDGALPDRYTGFDDDIAEYPGWVRAHPRTTLRRHARARGRACAGSRRPAASTSRRGWTGSRSTRSSSPRSPTWARPTWT